ncbi:alpha-amylase [Methanolobus sp. ZRKC3]|uniref:alpha-amylase n=1 Tax=Methanolobus sp. ZRKC3 TaxID=3125786 RepID=UPI00324FEF73
MKAVCVCFEVHLPLPTRWYWPREGYTTPAMDNYFDIERSFNNYSRLQRDIEVINDALIDSIERGGKYTFDISGIFMEQCKWAPEIMESFRLLGKKGAHFAASPYYHSICSLFPDIHEFREQVQMHVNAIESEFGITPSTFINSELLLEQRSMEIIKEMGFECFISEGSHNLSNGIGPVHVYHNDIPTLLRHINLSEDIEKYFSDKKWSGYPLIADKFATWIANMQGDIVTLYIKYDSLHNHLQNGEKIVSFLKELPASLEAHGIEMLHPEEAAEKFKAEKLPSLQSKKTARYGMHNLMGNHAQHLYLHEIQNIGKKIEKMKHGDPGKMKAIFRYLQQSEILLEMGNDGYGHGYEKAVNNFSIISDIKRALLEEDR